MARLAERNDPATEQPLPYLREPGPDVVMPPDRPRPPGHDELTLGRGSEHTRTFEDVSEGTQVLNAEVDIGIDVNARETAGHAIARGECFGLGCRSHCQHLYR